MIALLNLLNRLSESVKFVHERGSSVEKILEQIVEPPVYNVSTWQRMQDSIAGIRYVLYFFLHVVA